MADSRYVLWAEGIGKYFGDLEALKAASVWAEPGRVTTLMGRNGSGKTTLLRIAAGVLRPDRGVVWLNGDATPHPRLPRLARGGLMWVPQHTLLAPIYRLRDHFDALAATFSSATPSEAIERCRVESLLDQRVAELSGGEKVRASLALAFARRPRVLLADEPLVGLTPREQELMAGLLRELAREGTAVVTSGHDVRSLLDVSDVIIWSVAGTTHVLGSPTQARQNEQFAREYLGPKYLEA